MKGSLWVSSELNQWPRFGKLYWWISHIDYLTESDVIHFEIWVDVKKMLHQSSRDILVKFHLNRHEYNDHKIYYPKGNTSGIGTWHH